MPMAIIFHDNMWPLRGLIIINDDIIGIKFLSIEYFLCKFTVASFDKHEFLLILRLENGLIINLAQIRVILSLRNKELSNERFAVWYVSKI